MIRDLIKNDLIIEKMEKKLTYVSPDVEIILVVSEGVMQAVSGDGKAGGPQSYNIYEEDF